ncbi:MAG: alpha/beta fold hydrolase, partial [Spirochaetia bacterium]|nr:alpha/beta fold hydrolase [Spirochaetia bacterium]
MKLHLRKLGEGRPLLILHGLFGSGDNWLAVAKKISEAGYACLLPDARNHGLSPHSETWDIPSMAADAAEL